MLESIILLGSIARANVDMPLVSPMFGDHMVLQRDKPNRVWGWGLPNETVEVEIDGRKVRTTVSLAGEWSVMIAPPLTGGPYKLRVASATTEELFEDVLVGDVWICSGQSNMEMGISQVKDASKEIQTANLPQLRTFMVSRAVGYEPAKTVNGEWRVCTPQNIVRDGWGGFSGVGYFFGRKLQRDLGVPIGMVSTSWGGTAAEAWASRESIASHGDFDDDLALVDKLKAQGGEPLGTYLEIWMRENDAVIQGGKNPYESGIDSSAWKPVQVPNGFDDLFGKGKNGLAWFKKEFELPDPLPAGRAELKLGSMRIFDWAWVNGQSLGFTGWAGDRNYWMWPGSVKPGRNELTIRLMNVDGQGGFLSSAEQIYVQLGDGSKIPLAGEWKAAIGKEIEPTTPKPQNYNVNPTVPSVLYNGMLAPIAPLAIRGAIWYQGETNDGRGYQYRTLLPAMVGSWRKAFRQGDFPFYIVSLANFGPLQQSPGEDTWAEVREAQFLASRSLRNAGLAVTIDVGEANDIHPRDKQTVGERLALNALAKDYGKNVEFSGPVYKSMRVRGNEAWLNFDHGAGLTLREGNAGFSVAGADRKWHWGVARVEKDSIVVSSDAVAKPVAVRYAWGKNPFAGLYNKAGLPAVPFRTDNWKLMSQPDSKK